MVSGVPFVREYLVPEAIKPVNDSVLVSDPQYVKQINARSRELATIRRRFDALTPGQNYLVINTTDNRFYLYRNRALIREGYCSSGSYIHLKTHDDREWIFKTPRGMFRIQGKTTYPVWRKPDWAFVEEGLPVPAADHHSRFEYGALGDYALSLGDGYLIHGTIYKRSLGMPVTHGCIRLNDDDLEAVFNSLYVGSKVYIY
ncbi:MAG: L,D-transpeptidase [Bacteroidales bacterium]|nr:L,D-transpeptidase [Bacteroidales bacterium]